MGEEDGRMKPSSHPSWMYSSIAVQSQGESTNNWPWGYGPWEQVNGAIKFPVGRQNWGLFFTEDLPEVPLVSEEH